MTLSVANSEPDQPAPPAQPSAWEMWNFYWPLALTGFAMLLVNQFQNGALARYPNAARELAVFALASSSFQLFNSALVFTPHMANTFVRSRRGLSVCLRFTILAALALTLPLALMAYAPPGRAVLGLIFGIGGDRLDDVVIYLRYLTPLVLVSGLRQFFTGMLVQLRRTLLVTLLNVAYLGAVVVVLVTGFRLGWRPILTIASAQVLAALLHLVLSIVLVLKFYRFPAEQEHTALTYAQTMDYFWPTALTSIMFALSRPIIYMFLARIPDGTPTIAAMRVGFDFAMIFHNALNQFRHVFVTFGSAGLAAVRRFMVQVTVVVVTAMALVSVTPLSTLVLEHLLGIEGPVLRMTREVLLVLCLLPVVVNVRNYYHGVALLRRTTGRMGAGAVSRNVATYLMAGALFSLGWLNHVTAALTLLAGFVAETAMVMAAPHLRRAAGNGVARLIGRADSA